MSETVNVEAAVRWKDSVLAAIAETCGMNRTELGDVDGLDDLGINSIMITAVIAELENTLERAFTLEEIIVLFGAMSFGELVDSVVSLASSSS